MVAGGVFIPIISTKGINQIKKGNCKKKKEFYAYKKMYYIFKNMGAIPRIPKFIFNLLLVQEVANANKYVYSEPCFLRFLNDVNTGRYKIIKQIFS